MSVDLAAALGWTSASTFLVEPTVTEPRPVSESAARAPSTTLDDIVIARCRTSLFRYVVEQWKRCPTLASTALELGFDPPPGAVLPDRGHIKTICDHLQGQLEDAAARRDNPSKVLRAQNLLINCPPRSLKTILLALASAWAWIRWPYLQILYVSATPSMILVSARVFRDAVSSDWYQQSFVGENWKIRDDQDALSSIGNTVGGARVGKGFEAKVLGSSADWLQTDDAHDMNDSPESIQAACEHYDQNLSSRINDPRTGIRTAIMQRCARGDFSEHVLAQGWFHLRMPLEFEKHPECRCPQCLLCESRTPNAFGWVDWRTTEGEVLHPRYTAEFRAERMLVLRPHGYAGQMQQRPAPKGGNQFKVAFWRFATIDGELPGGSPGTPAEIQARRPHGAREGPATLTIKRREDGRLDVEWVCLSVDVTGGSTNTDASALGLVGACGLAERRIILADYTPGPRSWGQTMGDIKGALVSLANLTGWYTKIRVLVEKKALGEAAIVQLTEAIADGELKDRLGRVIHAIVEAYEPTGKGSKEQRAEVLEPMLESGLLFLLDGALWLTRPYDAAAITTLVDEFSAFPKGSRDDRVDCCSQLIDRYRKKTSDWTKLFA